MIQLEPTLWKVIMKYTVWIHTSYWQKTRLLSFTSMTLREDRYFRRYH
jgi:competence CoiA-like predicted nuclease